MAHMDPQRRKKGNPIAKGLVLSDFCLIDEKKFLFELLALESTPERMVSIGAHHKLRERLKIPGPRDTTTTARPTTTKIEGFLR
jgi:hypothetical protein